MLSKRTLFSLLFVVIFSQNIFCSGKMEEANIPPPENQYDLPENLIGDFVLINSWVDREVKIFPNNKFISRQTGSDHTLLEFWGYVVKRGNSWYFTPVNNALNSNRTHPFFSDLTEITLLDNGFSFHERFGGEINIAVPKTVISENTKMAEEVSVNREKVNQQYYLFEQSGKKQIVDYAEFTFIKNFPPFYPLYHSLEISGGNVNLARLFPRTNGTIGQWGTSWIGFIENGMATLDGMTGTIRFTNGVPHYYVSDGTALLEIKNDTIILTMQCTTVVENRIREKYPDAQSPMFLVLEF